MDVLDGHVLVQVVCLGPENRDRPDEWSPVALEHVVPRYLIFIAMAVVPARKRLVPICRGVCEKRVIDGAGLVRQGQICAGEI